MVGDFAQMVVARSKVQTPVMWPEILDFPSETFIISP